MVGLVLRWQHVTYKQLGAQCALGHVATTSAEISMFVLTVLSIIIHISRVARGEDSFKT